MPKIKKSNVDIPVIILAGGKGTRLRGVVVDRPKVLALIGHVPFLVVLLNWLEKEGVKEVVFSLGFEAQKVVRELNRLKGEYSLSIRYAIELDPLGTLGGLSYTSNTFDIHECLVINGDTFVDVKLDSFVEQQRKVNAFSGLVAKYIDDTSRYGQLSFKDEIYLVSFVEKDPNSSISGWINAGVYYLSAAACELVKAQRHGSIETDFLCKYIESLTYFKVHQGKFIDIGTPKSYQQAQLVLKEYIK